MNKLPGFTISELLVVSLLSLIAAMASFTAIEHFNTTFRLYESDTSQVITRGKTYALINKDFITANLIKVKGNELIFNYPQHNIHYQIEADKIIRFPDIIENNPDTLLQGIFLKQAFFKKTKMEYGIIDHLELNIESEGENLNFSFSKNYSAKTLMDGLKN